MNPISAHLAQLKAPRFAGTMHIDVKPQRGSLSPSVTFSYAPNPRNKAFIETDSGAVQSPAMQAKEDEFKRSFEAQGKSVSIAPERTIKEGFHKFLLQNPSQSIQFFRDLIAESNLPEASKALAQTVINNWVTYVQRTDPDHNLWFPISGDYGLICLVPPTEDSI